ncbi:MAG: DUF4443 domain-containing protein [Candidatus Methanomethylicaceae archaeon]|jgi:hypothetical protein
MAASLKSFIGQISKTEAPKGPSPAFSASHIIKVLLILDSEQTMGRITLSKRLGIGEGSVRTIVKKLVEMLVISVDAVGGCHLTDLGQSLVTDLKTMIIATAEVRLSSMGINLPAYAIHLRGLKLDGTSLTRLRDIAVKNGADGMVIFSYSGGHISMPLMTEDVYSEYPETIRDLKSGFDLRDGDSILIGFSANKNQAEMGALSAFISLINA